ncbi:rRNA pseudouridine synthase [Candidatus Saccharibacteria bacterium]|nr:rRNA pseudouridine synthase [Candidatus Saccharibacteria bacterium]
MRLNKFIALSTGISRRAADKAISDGRVTLNNKAASIGDIVEDLDEVKIDGQSISIKNKTTIMLNKPVGYVCSRDGQGSKTVYDLLPANLYNLKPVGRLDKDSSGLLLLTNDGDLAQKLTHPSFQKQKIYEVTLDKELSDKNYSKVGAGIRLEDGLSKLEISKIGPSKYEVKMYEGRNRQIRRTFERLGHRVIKLHRKNFGAYELNNLKEGMFKNI